MNHNETLIPDMDPAQDRTWYHYIKTYVQESLSNISNILTGSSDTVTATEDHDQGPVQQISLSNLPEFSRESVVHPSGQGDGEFHQYSHHKQIDPQIAVPTSDYTYPSPPTARLDVSDTTDQNIYQDIRSPSHDSRGASSPSQASEAMMNGPSFEDENPDENLAVLQPVTECLKDFEEDKDGLKRLRTKQPVLPVPAATENNIPPQITSRWSMSPQLIPRQVDRPSRASPAPHARSSKTRELPGPPIMAPGSEPVDYSTISPSNNEEVQSPINVMHWGRSVDDWEPPVEDSIYDEALRMGDRAEREVDWQSMDILDLTGDMLEIALRRISNGDDRAG